jgi:hypothetical protein
MGAILGLKAKKLRRLEGILKKFSQQNQVENVFLSQKSQVHRKGGNRLVYVYASQATFHQTSKKVGIHI